MAEITTQLVNMIDTLSSETEELLSTLVKCDTQTKVQDVMEVKFRDELQYEIDRFEVNKEEISSLKGYSPISWNYKGDDNVVATHTPKLVKGKKPKEKKSSTK